MCSTDNCLADDKHKATFNLVLKKKNALEAKLYADPLRSGYEKRFRTVCTYGRQIFTYSRVSHRIRPTQSYLFTLTAQNSAY